MQSIGLILTVDYKAFKIQKHQREDGTLWPRDSKSQHMDSCGRVTSIGRLPKSVLTGGPEH